MILEVKGLNKSFRHPWNLQMVQVLHDVSFCIEKPSVVGFLGANGAGKTTSIKCLIGLLTYQSGDLKILGEHHLAKTVKRNIGYLPERPFFYNYLTAREFLRFYAELSGMNRQNISSRSSELLELVGLRHAENLYLNQFSKGMLQRIGLAQALIHRPKLLILDEPLSGLDPDGRRQLVSIINNTHENEGTTIFFSSHLLDDVDRLCKDLVVIQKGRVKYNGAKNDFVSQSRPGFNIQYSLQGKNHWLKEGSAETLQKQIDSLRGQGAQILTIEAEKISLDQAFKQFQQQELQS